MTDLATVYDLFNRACLVFDARAIHARGPAGAYTVGYLNQLADELLELLNACGVEERHYLVEAYRCVSLAAIGPAGQACLQLDLLLDVTRQGLAHAIVQITTGRPPSQEDVWAMLEDTSHRSLLAWAELFPSALDHVSPPCVCGTLSPPLKS
ncbi:hypothetical protein [Streptomyces sp. NPDC054865]